MIKKKSRKRLWKINKLREHTDNLFYNNIIYLAGINHF